MPDQFGGIAVDEKPAADQFGGVPVEDQSVHRDQTGAAVPPPAYAPGGSPFTGSDGIAVAKNVYPSLGPILSAFGHGAKDGWGDEPIGVPDEAAKWLSDKGIFGPEKGGFQGLQGVGQAFNELLAHTVVGAVQIGTRTVNAAFGAYQAGVAETGEQVGAPSLGRDLAAMPEAFFGSPHPMGIPKELPTPLAGPKPEGVYHIFEPLGAGEGEYANVKLMRDKDGKIEALDTDRGILKVGPNYQSLSPEEAIAHTMGDHPDGTAPDLSKVGEGPAPVPFPSSIPDPGAVPPRVAEARDLGVMPEAFFGSAHPMAEIKTQSGLPHDEPVGVPANPILGPAGFDAYHGTPHSFDAFSTAKIGTGEGAQAYGHGLYFAENEQIAKGYRSRLTNMFEGIPDAALDDPIFGERLGELKDRADSMALKIAKEDRTEKLVDLNEQYQKIRDEFEPLLKQAKEKYGGNVYQVRINADQGRMLDWDSPFSAQSPEVQQSMRTAAENYLKTNLDDYHDVMHAITADEGADTFYERLADALKTGKKTAPDANGFYKFDTGHAAASQALQDAGIPGIKYLDSGSRASGDGSRNFVIFNEGDIQITHKNGEPIPTPLDHINQARDLGVIGPPKPDMTGLSPAEKAAAEVPPPPKIAAAARGDDVVRGTAPGEPEKAGNIRLDQIGINADAKDVILDAAKNNDDFNQARQGNVPLAQVESLSGASGVPSDILTGNDGLGRLMHNDAVVRTWLQAFHQATDEIADQMQTVARTGDEADVAKLREMKLRFQHMQEQVSGLTAEAGRTLGVFREFYANKGKAEALGKILEDNPGMDADSLKKLADTGAGLNDPAALARYLHDSNKPTFWDKYLYYWTNALISGPVTHVKYIGANLAFGAYEAGVVTPIAGALGTVRRLAGGTDGVYVGEAAARAWGLLAGTPDAIRAAWTAAKNNVMTPFENEVAGKQVNPLTSTRPAPIGGKLGFALGIPGRSAAGIHSFFRFLGYRAEIEAQAYRQAAKEGLSPTGQAFWDRRGALADQPTDEMMNAGIENGNHLTFIGEQGSFGKLMSTVANFSPAGKGGIQPFKLILPFTHIPGQILRAGLEQTPAAFLDTKMRSDLLGKNGAVAADTARARLVAGGAVSAMVANWAVNDTITGYGPTDQTERAQWLRTHEPYSVRLGGWWYSYNKFGPIGDLAGLVANLVEVGPKVADNDYADAAGHVMKATSRMLEDEVGMQGLVNLLDAMDDPDKKMARFVSSQAASNMPMSSLLRQGASVTDPYMREAKTFVDQLRYAVPWARQDLLPKRDWLGSPMTNPGYASIIRQRAVNDDPVDLAVSQLRGFKPAPPQARIGGVALPPKLYDEYQMTAGAMTRAGLEPIVTSPRWGEIPPGIREQTIHSIVENARRTAGSMLQARHPEIIMQGISNRNDKISGAKPGKLAD